MSAPRPVRLPGQRQEEWTDETAELFEGVVPGPRGRPLHLPSVVAHQPALLGPYLEWAKAVALEGVLPARDGALLALRTALACSSEFEWGVHSERAVVGRVLRPDEVAAVAEGSSSSVWDEHERALLDAADQLHATATVEDATWSVLARRYDSPRLLEVLVVVGHYTMLSMVANGAGVPPAPGWAPLGHGPESGGDDLA